MRRIYAERMVPAVRSGQSRREVARRRLDGSASWVIKLMRRLAATGECRRRKFGGHKRYAMAGHADKVRALRRLWPIWRKRDESVMMDNSPPARGIWSARRGSAKRAGVRNAIEAGGAAVCFLPA